MKDYKEIIDEIIIDYAREEALEIINLTNCAGREEFMEYYEKNQFNICCLVLDKLKENLVKENKLVKKDSDNFGQFF